MPAAYFNILTPDKGTPLFDRMKEGNLIKSIDDMGRWPGDRCYIRPSNFTAATLEKRVREIHKSFYSYSSMPARRLLPPSRQISLSGL